MTFGPPTSHPTIEVRMLWRSRSAIRACDACSIQRGGLHVRAVDRAEPRVPPPSVSGSARGPGRTAVLSAVGRALYLEEPPPHVLEDRLAALLAGEQGGARVREQKSEGREELMATFRRGTTVRTRFTEDAVEQAVASGVRQFAIL